MAQSTATIGMAINNRFVTTQVIVDDEPINLQGHEVFKVTFPKSGSTQLWLSQGLEQAMDLAQEIQQHVGS